MVAPGHLLIRNQRTVRPHPYRRGLRWPRTHRAHQNDDARVQRGNWQALEVQTRAAVAGKDQLPLICGTPKAALSDDFWRELGQRDGVGSRWTTDVSHR